MALGEFLSIRQMLLWEKVDFTTLTREQQWVLHLIVDEKLTRNQIIERWKRDKHQTLSMEALCNCIKRIALSIPWHKGMSGGNMCYLCPQDLKYLERRIRECAEIDQAYDTDSIIEEAQKIKGLRVQIAIDVLQFLKADKYAQDLSKEEIKPPTRQWVNTILPKINTKLFYPIFIDTKRFLACRVDIIESFFTNFGDIIANTPPALLFTADETMVQISTRNKVLIPNDFRIYFEPKGPELPHITAMCTSNVLGAKPPLFVVLKKLKNLPKELAIHVDLGRVWIASSSNGWMDRHCFLMWTIHFLCWLQEYRGGLPDNIKNMPALLILDGHKSRENPLALELFKYFNVEVIVLPSHTTHILQFFDVSIASPLKKEFTDLFVAMLKAARNYNQENMSAVMRKVALEAFLEAWDKTCTYRRCIDAATAVGYQPDPDNHRHIMCPEKPLNSKHVKPRLEEREQQIVDARAAAMADRLNINNKMITTDDAIQEIRMLLNTGNAIFGKNLNEFPDFPSLCRAAFHPCDKSNMLGSSQRCGYAHTKRMLKFNLNFFFYFLNFYTFLLSVWIKHLFIFFKKSVMS